MKLVHPDFLCHIELPEDKVTVLVLEHPNRFLNFTTQMYNQINGIDEQWTLSKKGKILPLNKNCELIVDLFSLDINQRKLVSALHNQLEATICNTELLLNWNNIYPVLASFAEKVLEESEEHLIYRNELDIKDFLKFMNISFCASAQNTVEKLIDYLTLVSNVLGIKLFILCNIKSYLSQKQLGYLYEQAFYKKFHLLLIENHVSKQIFKEERVIIIDKDDCLIY